MKYLIRVIGDQYYCTYDTIDDDFAIDLFIHDFGPQREIETDWADDLDCSWVNWLIVRVHNNKQG